MVSLGLRVSVVVILCVISHAMHNTYMDWAPTRKFKGWMLQSNDGCKAFARDEITCIAGCVLTYRTGCLAVSYSPRNYMCLHFSGKKIRTGRSEHTDDVVILTSRSPALFHREMVAFENASAGCGTFGGRILEPLEATAVYDAGVTHCTCGWLNNGSAVVISQPYVNYTCGDGVMPCGSSSTNLTPPELFGTWCRINEDVTDL